MPRLSLTLLPWKAFFFCFTWKVLRLIHAVVCLQQTFSTVLTIFCPWLFQDLSLSEKETLAIGKLAVSSLYFTHLIQDDLKRNRFLYLQKYDCSYIPHWPILLKYSNNIKYSMISNFIRNLLLMKDIAY